MTVKAVKGKTGRGRGGGEDLRVGIQHRRERMDCTETWPPTFDKLSFGESWTKRRKGGQ